MSIVECFILSVIVMAIHYLVAYSPASGRVLVMQRYSDCVSNVVSAKVKAIDWLFLIVLTVPVFIIIYVLVSVCQAILFHSLYFILTLILIWSCTDLIDSNIESAESLLIQRFRCLFVPIFWFCLIGVTATVVVMLMTELAKLNKLDQNCQFLLRKCLGYVNWLPERLFSMSLALVGFFNPAFQVWIKGLYLLPDLDSALVTRCGMAALGEQESVDSTLNQYAQMRLLIFRAFVLWLMVIILFGLAVLIG